MWAFWQPTVCKFPLYDTRFTEYYKADLYDIIRCTRFKPIKSLFNLGSLFSLNENRDPFSDMQLFRGFILDTGEVIGGCIPHRLHSGYLHRKFRSQGDVRLPV